LFIGLSYADYAEALRHCISRRFLQRHAPPIAYASRFSGCRRQLSPLASTPDYATPAGYFRRLAELMISPLRHYFIFSPGFDLRRFFFFCHVFFIDIDD